MTLVLHPAEDETAFRCRRLRDLLTNWRSTGDLEGASEGFDRLMAEISPNDFIRIAEALTDGEAGRGLGSLVEGYGLSFQVSTGGAMGADAVAESREGERARGQSVRSLHSYLELIIDPKVQVISESLSVADLVNRVEQIMGETSTQGGA